MPLDAICVAELSKELGTALDGARIDKILQPERDEIVLLLRGPRGSFRLLVSCSPSHPRVHITTNQKENPKAPPMFCMLLRKHLTGGRFVSVSAPPFERAVSIVFDTLDELGERSEKTLTVEMMGKNSNIILIGSDGRIIDAVRKVDYEMSERRQVLPGLFYRQPPRQDKPVFCETDMESFVNLIKNLPDGIEFDKWLVDTFAAIPPVIAREIAFRACGDTSPRMAVVKNGVGEAFVREFTNLCEDIAAGRLKPFMLIRDGLPFDFSYREIKQYGSFAEPKEYEDYSSLLDDFYSRRDNAERMRQKAQSMVKSIGTLRDRAARKAAFQQKEIDEAGNRERLRRIGDILMANLHLLNKGTNKAVLSDFYEEGSPDIEIKLDPKLTPQQNAAKYYKDYNRAKNARLFLAEQIKKAEEEIFYLDSVLEGISRADKPSELEEIRRELEEGGYVSYKRENRKPEPVRPKKYRSSSGIEIYAGVNNKQNDLLTTKIAAKNDIWLHTQKIHGAHVIIDCSNGPPDDLTLEEAAIIAAYNSKARDSANVPVDYTQVRNVKKPVGAKPGMVIYDKYKTIFVTPDAHRVKELG